MITYAITGFILFEAIALVNLVLAIQDAPEGWEDETGFHAGRPVYVEESEDLLTLV